MRQRPEHRGIESVRRIIIISIAINLPGGTVVKNSPANAGDMRDTDSILALGGSPGGVHGNPLQYSFLENPMDREAQWSTVRKVALLKRLSTQKTSVSRCSPGVLPNALHGLSGGVFIKIL